MGRIKEIALKEANKLYDLLVEAEKRNDMKSAVKLINLFKDMAKDYKPKLVMEELQEAQYAAYLNQKAGEAMASQNPFNNSPWGAGKS